MKSPLHLITCVLTIGALVLSGCSYMNSYSASSDKSTPASFPSNQDPSHPSPSQNLEKVSGSSQKDVQHSSDTTERPYQSKSNISIRFNWRNHSITVNGESGSVVPFDFKQNQVYAPLAFLAQTLGLHYFDDIKSGDITTAANGAEFIVNPAIERVWINQIPERLSTLGYTSGGRLFVSVQKIADTFGLYYEVRTSTHQAVIADPGYPYANGSLQANPNIVPVSFQKYVKYPLIKPQEQRIADRKLLFSDSPETFHRYSILYEEQGSGKFRFFDTHVNGMDVKAVYEVIATNLTDQQVTLKTVRRGEPAPTQDYARMGREAEAAWLTPSSSRALTIPAHQSAVYYQSPVLKPQDGVHFIDDVDASGTVRFDFAAIKPGTTPSQVSHLAKAKPGFHDRGTFAVSEIDWQLNGAAWSKGPIRYQLGAWASASPEWVTGLDGITGSKAVDYGNYGVMYHVHITHPGKASFVLVPVRGYYQGSLSFQQHVVQIPGIDVGRSYLIGRTAGSEKSADLEVSAPSGSFMPFELFVYPG